MAGYNYKYQMSNNAVDAYKSGCKPYDQWAKGDLMDEIQKLDAAHGTPWKYVAEQAVEGQQL